MSELLQDFNNAQLALGFSTPRTQVAADISIAARNLLTSPCLADQDAARHITSDFEERDLMALRNSPLKAFGAPIAEEGVLGWIQDADAQDAHTFMSWLDLRTSQLQQRLDYDRPELDGLAEQYMDILIQANLYPRYALTALRRSFKTIRPQAVGTFEAQGVLGYFDGETIGIANIYDDRVIMKGVGMTLRNVNFHERDHSLGELPHLLDETVASHHTAVALATAEGAAGEPAILDPHHRQSPIGVEYYALERRLIADITAYTRLTPDTFAEARLEGEGSPAYEKVATEMIGTYDSFARARGAFCQLLCDYANAPTRAKKQTILWSAYDIVNPPLAI